MCITLLSPLMCWQVSSLDMERGRLQEQLFDARSNGGRLEAQVAADAAVIAELRNRLSTAEARLEVEQAARVEASGRLMAAEVQIGSSRDRTSELSRSLAGKRMLTGNGDCVHGAYSQ